MKRGFRVLAFVAAAALALVALPASAAHEDTYLALGDSYAFAYNPVVIATGGGSNPANFPGYSDIVASASGLTLTNAACPGETSGSMISGRRPDNGCQDFRSLYPLHVKYDGAQLAFATHYLRSHKHTDLVTLQIGGNDVLTLQTACLGDASCIINGLPAVEAQMTANLNAIYTAIRNRGHYDGTIVAVPYFAFNYNDQANVFIVRSLDQTVATVAAQHGALVADVFDAFYAASAPSHVPCFAGLQIPTPGASSPCDIHPSAAGHAVIAQAIMAVVPPEDND
jgi:lysophospholipase L1-like esterase